MKLKSGYNIAVAVVPLVHKRKDITPFVDKKFGIFLQLLTFLLLVMKDKKIDYEDEPQLWRKRKKSLTPKSYQMSHRRLSARRSPRRPLPPLQRPRHPPRN